MSKSSVQYSRGYFRTQKSQKLSVSLHNSTQFGKKFHWNKICEIQSEENEQEGKQQKSRANVGQMSMTCQRSRKTRFVSSFEFLTFCYQFEISMKVVKELGKRIELAKKT